MSMTREEAIEILRKRQRCCKVIAEHANETVKADELREIEAIDLALTSLRGPTREMVERMFPECEYCRKHTIKFVRIEMDYNDSPGSPWRLNPTRTPKFCPICGAPMTDEAVEMVMERMEEMKDGKTDRT